MINAKIGKNIKINQTVALFGVQKGSFLEQKYINYLILVGKMCISIYKKTQNPPPIVLLFEQQVNLRKKHL